LESEREAFFDLLREAAVLAEDQVKHARSIAQKLSHQLQSAEEQIQELKADVQYYRDIADQAEKCLRLLLIDRNQKALSSGESRSRAAEAKQSGPDSYAPPKYRSG
jgi:hypothetical protein